MKVKRKYRVHSIHVTNEGGFPSGRTFFETYKEARDYAESAVQAGADPQVIFKAVEVIAAEDKPVVTHEVE